MVMKLNIIFINIYIIYFKLMYPELNDANNWFMSISPEGIGFVGMILNFTVALITSSLTKPPPKEIARMVDLIRQPK